ncbi:5-carboxymethyl-2-hydroxymuconate isomerase [Pseudoalteromonas rubra]|uniref:5-carboxymethyl-2-hydroxymuconate isomerase n=1 Tax=Pseudoalteromonas rubra TaxID=43658 RepID=A0A5S3WSN2_9GAMM|nr:5-carboxymethyl-2-hydroxymuconate Delta-isomerase [Pseudoalteromonas rubra]TMP32357.1 5-carboxymethyl-2-hydroxymuconate isomerase [Pseudoalteromonas rubra]TMP36353.1 5-carboxymethyl-2-hydroxymuconate isomerase [Pseudoalteromonas rubra]
MPHLIIEHSANLDIPVSQLVKAVHQGAEGTQLFDPSSIKTRAIAYSEYQLGGERQGFIHVQAHIISGRTLTQKQQLSDALLSALRLLIQDQQINLSVHPYDLDPEIYRKN